MQTTTLRLKRNESDIRYGLLSGIAFVSMAVFVAGATLPSLKGSVARAPLASLPVTYPGGYASNTPDVPATTRQVALAPSRAPLRTLEIPAEGVPAIKDAAPAEPVAPPVPKPVAAMPKKASPVLDRFARHIAADVSTLRETTVQARSGDSAVSLLKAAGVSEGEASALSKALNRSWNTRNLKEGTLFAVVQRTDGMRTVEGMYLRRDARTEVMVRRNGEGFAGKIVERPLDTQWMRAKGTITSSFAADAAAKGMPDGIRQQVIRAFSQNVNFQRDVGKGDGFEVLFETSRDKEEGTPVGSPRLLSASLTMDGKTRTLYAFEQDGVTRFFDRNGSSARKAMMGVPVANPRITSGFGMRRHPILRYSKMHRGLDYGTPVGTPVYAPADGIVRTAGRLGGYGNYMRLAHSNVYDTAYGHLSRFAPGIRPGVRVNKGQVIAYTGNTGRSTGPHLHFEVLKNNVQINPQTATVAIENRLAGTELAQFRQQIAGLERGLRSREVLSTVAQLNR